MSADLLTTCMKYTYSSIKERAVKYAGNFGDVINIIYYPNFNKFSLSTSIRVFYN